jgi:outer membrane protein OmpA-like peptidoglycan-associated protein
VKEQKRTISTDKLLKKNQTRIVMNQKCLIPAFRGIGPAVILFSFFLAGCCGTCNEVRYDDSVRQYSIGKDQGESHKASAGSAHYVVGQDDGATAKYTVGKYGDGKLVDMPNSSVMYVVCPDEDATAKYVYRLGNRPDYNAGGQPSANQSASQKNLADAMAAGLPLVIEVSDILFDFDKAVIKAAYVPELDRWVDYFLKNPAVTAEIYGHADSTGPEAYNQKLSERRAQAVVNYMMKNGIEAGRLSAIGFGESQPAVPNTTKENRQKNRRVELNF